MAKILIVEDTADTRNLIRIKLTKAGHEILTAEDGEAALSLAFRQNPHLIVLDVMLPKLDGFSVARRLRQASITSQVPILMLTAKGEIADKVQGFEAGADDYLTKPFDPAELEMRVRTLLARSAPSLPRDTPSRLGKLISVFSLRGGVGKTTLAVNLAVTLAQLWNQPVPLLDFVLQNGQAAIFLGSRPRATIDDLTDIWKDYPDANALSDFFTMTQSQVHLLAAPRQPASADRVTSDMLRHLTRLVRSGFPLAIADLSSQLDDHTLAVLDTSDLILLIMAPEIASVHTMVEMLDTFKALGYAEDKLQVVVNNVFSRRSLTPGQIEGAIARRVSLVIPYDGEFFVHAINAGEPYVNLAPTSAATRALQDFAFQLGRPDSVDGDQLSPLAKMVQARVKK